MCTDYVAVEFEIIQHGITGSQYFQGCGTSCTQFDVCFTGCGDNPQEALEDALEQAWSSGWNPSIIVNDTLPDKPSVCDRIEEAQKEAKEAAYLKWAIQQEDAGKVHIDEATPADIEAGNTYDPDDFEEEEDGNWDGDYSDSYYYLSILLRGPDRHNAAEMVLAARMKRLRKLARLVHNLKLTVKRPCKGKKQQKKRLHKLKKEQKKLQG